MVFIFHLFIIHINPSFFPTIIIVGDVSHQSSSHTQCLIGWSTDHNSTFSIMYKYLWMTPKLDDDVVLPFSALSHHSFGNRHVPWRWPSPITYFSPISPSIRLHIHYFSQLYFFLSSLYRYLCLLSFPKWIISSHFLNKLLYTRTALHWCTTCRPSSTLNCCMRSECWRAVQPALALPLTSIPETWEWCVYPVWMPKVSAILTFRTRTLNILLIPFDSSKSIDWGEIRYT